MKSGKPSDRLSGKARFAQQQCDLEFSRLDQARNDLRAISHLSPDQRRALVAAAPAFVAGEGAK